MSASGEDVTRGACGRVVYVCNGCGAEHPQLWDLQHAEDCPPTTTWRIESRPTLGEDLSDGDWRDDEPEGETDVEWWENRGLDGRPLRADRDARIAPLSEFGRTRDGES